MLFEFHIVITLKCSIAGSIHYIYQLAFLVSHRLDPYLEVFCLSCFLEMQFLAYMKNITSLKIKHTRYSRHVLYTQSPEECLTLLIVELAKLFHLLVDIQQIAVLVVE